MIVQIRVSLPVSVSNDDVCSVKILNKSDKNVELSMVSTGGIVNTFILPPLLDEIKVNEIFNFPNEPLGSDALNRPMDSMDLSGQLFQFTIPSNLVLALLDDQARVDIYSTETSTTKYTSIRNQPSVHEILLRVQESIAKIGKRCDDYVFDHLQSCFELEFENSLLYKEETLWIQKELQQCKEEKIPFLSAYGAVYLLRFVVFLIVNVTHITTPVVHSSGMNPLNDNETERFKQAIFYIISYLDSNAYFLF